MCDLGRRGSDTQHPRRRFCCHVLCWATTDKGAIAGSTSEALREVPTGSVNWIHNRAYRRISARRSGSAMHSASERHSNALARYSLAAALMGDLRSISCPHLQKVAGGFVLLSDAIGRQFLRGEARSEHPRTSSELHSRRKSSRLGKTHSAPANRIPTWHSPPIRALPPIKLMRQV